MSTNGESTMKQVSSHVITFHHTLPDLKDTMLFEAEYPPELQEELDTKLKLIHYGLPLWLRIDGELAGELLGASPLWLTNVNSEPIPDTHEFDDHSFYVYTTTVLPKFRKQGLCQMLKVYMLGQLYARGYFKMIGHSTSTEMERINELFGAVHDLSRVHDDWYGSGRTATYYEIDLTKKEVHV